MKILIAASYEPAKVIKITAQSLEEKIDCRQSSRKSSKESDLPGLTLS